MTNASFRACTNQVGFLLSFITNASFRARADQVGFSLSLLTNASFRVRFHHFEISICDLFRLYILNRERSGSVVECLT